MKINAILPEKGRDLRLDLFRGVANWAIYLDHIPDNVVNWITTRNYGFSDAADLFVFISGYTASFVYARMMLDRGFIVGATRLTKRVWQLYVAHIILFVIYIASITYLALRFGDSEMIKEFNVAGLVDQATETLRQGLLLKFKPVNLDVLPLYIVLMGLFPLVLWFMLRQPDLTMVASIVLWLVSRQMGWNFTAYPAGTWYFNPLCWQVLFVFGAWCAMGGARKSMAIINSKYTLWFCIAYMILALVMTMAGKFRSEEHTSELQSLRHLVCRLLLEKKNIKNVRSSLKADNKHITLIHLPALHTNRQILLPEPADVMKLLREAYALVPYLRTNVAGIL